MTQGNISPEGRRVAGAFERLLDGLDRFIERAGRTQKQRVLAPLQKALEQAMQKAFRAQGREFLKRFEKLAGTFPVEEQSPGEGWEELFEDAAGATWDMFFGPLTDAIAQALGFGAAAMWASVSMEGSFSLKNPRAVEYLKQVGAMLVKTQDTTKEYIKTIVVQGIDEGWSYDQIAKRITERFEEFAVGKPQEHIDSRAHLVAVTECFPGDTLVAPFSRPILPLSLSSADALGIRTGFGAGSKPPIKWAARRWYEGSMVEITTASGNKLAGTPNHPILTDRGWVALDALVEGDNVICCGRREGMRGSHPYIDDVPAAFSQVFDALNDSGVVHRATASSMDFHGDGGKGYIDIVTPNGALSNNIHATTLKPIREKGFSGADLGQSPFTRGASIGHGPVRLSPTLAQASEIAHSPSRRSVGIGEADIALTGGEFRPLHQSGFGHIADVDAAILENRSDVVVRDAEAARNGLAGFSRFITRDRIVGIDKNLWWSGHVYNLHTRFGYYTANGVIVQNCGNAYEAGNYIVVQDLMDKGLKVEKHWSTMRDDKVSDGCLENEADGVEGWIPADEEHTSGHMHPLRFPGCRCDELYRVVNEGE